jgi:hypothetical protein
MKLARCTVAAVYAALLFSLGVVHAQRQADRSITVYKTPT